MGYVLRFLRRGRAAQFALSLGNKAIHRHPVGLSTSVLTQSTSHIAERTHTAEYTSAIQAEVKPFHINLFRTELGLTSSLHRLDELWKEQRNNHIERSSEGVKAREAMAMTATARWMYNAARTRTESRGMHKREDYLQTDSTQHHRLVTGGLDQIWVKTQHREKEGILL
ncbi:succinate dehydrogenase/fumarate reductase flavoprotein subunit [Paenibacillus shirakamiensis]|uniref:Succinate dehydrogenase/fumarate reductase flavoprotein subunit n=1 Tax=Paenibacillus shirakamiensis TaxID=1265935 RepID=A0ABS4JF01_9BACL|nr:succinate dehydrogenase/fumarate reductase flavoprotein subunit [Paenibacillus shirakamiensis]